MISPYIRALRELVGSRLLLLPSISAHVFDRSNRLLLARTSEQGIWTTPGGPIEPDEAPADAVVREVWEETGILVAPRAVTGVLGGPSCRVAYANGDIVQYVITLWHCEPQAAVRSGFDDETDAIGYFTYEEATRLALAPWLAAHLALVFHSPHGLQYTSATWSVLGSSTSLPA
jgi:8-oxo-dGTP diphosphatase